MSGQKRDGIDLDALAGVIHSVPGVECSHVDSKEPSCIRDARHVLAAGWVSPAAVAGRDAEIQRWKDVLVARERVLKDRIRASEQVAYADRAALHEARAVLGAVAALADEIDGCAATVLSLVGSDGVAARLRAVLAPVSGAVPVECACGQPDLEFPSQHFTHCPRFAATRGGYPMSDPVAVHEQEVRADDQRIAELEATVARVEALALSYETGRHGMQMWVDAARGIRRALAARSSGLSAPVQGDEA